MHYMGGKSQIAKAISREMLELSDKREVYVEPFIGGGSVGEQMVMHFDEAHISDAHEDLMLMWEAVINQGWVPPTEVSYEEYQALRYATEPSALRGFVGYACSFGGRWFEGYARNARGDCYALSGHRAVLRKGQQMRGASTSVATFDQLPAVAALPLIYCDPPYVNTKGYDRTSSYNPEAFWEKARSWSDLGADVFVSEYTAPAGWVSVWSREVEGRLDLRKERTKPIEKLFVWGESDLAMTFYSRAEAAA